MQVDDWRNAWPHGILSLTAPDARLPAEARDFLITWGMPRRLIFECATSFELSFAPLTQALAAYSTRVRWGDFYNPVFDRAWSLQLVIAEEDFCNGDASFCVHQDHGHVSRIDCQLPDPLCFVNSTVRVFGLSLLTARSWSANLQTRGTSASADDFKILAQQLATLDSAAFEDPEHYWPTLIASILDEEHPALEITDDPARSKPRF